MAALCPGVKYGLSSQENFGGNKDLIYVKLTDSAFRAIEEYIKNQNKFSANQNPTIKFLGNEGQLSFPSFHNGYASFKFSMSNTADMEGLGGSFECVQQTAPPRGSLEALGVIPHKIRIHANDDIYEATRHRMTVAEENHKNKCTREIKPNQTDIGRKVKVKQQTSSIRTASVPVPPSRRDTPPLPPPPLRDSLTKSYQPTASHKQPTLHSNNISTSGSGGGGGIVNVLGSTTNSNHQLSSARNQQNKPSIPDIARRPIRERLIHLLALRPFKKPELYERLMREGLREKKSMASILKQISSLKDNAFHLNRAMWNDVREDWPFYTESERQMLKRRKPQNLTPPGGSDGGSSGSGQSPTSTLPGSPPSVTSTKRPGYYDGVDGLPTKRPRISHYRKPSEPNYRTPVENVSQRRAMTDSRDASNMNPRSRERGDVIVNGHSTNNMTSTIPNGYNNENEIMFISNDKHCLSDDEDGVDGEGGGRVGGGIVALDNNRKRAACDSFGVNREKTLVKESGSNLSPSKDDCWTTTNNDAVLNDRNTRLVTINNEVLGNDRSNKQHINNNNNNGKMRQHNDVNDRKNYERIKQDGREPSRWNNIVTSTTQNSPDSQSDPISTMEPPGLPIVDSTVDPEFPDYLTEYTTIRNADQRRRYKSEFNADYAEYRDLHAIVEKVSRRFAELEERLKQENTASPKYKDIKKQIVREYQQNKQDLMHQKAKRRFQYLHDKLSHIKRLVLEYDQGIEDARY